MKYLLMISALLASWWAGVVFGAAVGPMVKRAK